MQQINFYLPEFRPNRQPLRAAHMGWALLVLTVLLVLLSFWSSSRTNQIAAQLVSEQEKLVQLESQVKALEARQPRRRGPVLANDVERLQSEIHRREQIKELITRQNLGNAEGFSGQMQALARQSMNDLSLEQFSLQDGGGYVELGGRVRSAELVPQYLRRLRQEDSFSKARFGVLDVSRNESQDLMFSLSRFKVEGARQ